MTHEELTTALRDIVEAARLASDDIGDEVARLLQEADEHPLTEDEALAVLDAVVEIIRASAEARGDTETIQSLSGKVTSLIDAVSSSRRPGRQASSGAIEFLRHDGVDPGPVLPTPVFHGRAVPMVGGYVKTEDIRLWDRNDRLDVHIAQFQHSEGRPPTPTELLRIMLSEMSLPGIEAGDQFKIVGLARSIAENGVRRPPILDRDGTLLDGNRRVAACFYILNSPEFSTEQKRRAHMLYVWQLTPAATDDDRDAVVVSLNFEDDHKEPWPEYVKARRVWEEWQAMLALQPYRPGAREQAALRREIADKFALGPKTDTVARYIKMVDEAEEFEAYLQGRGKDEFEAKHLASRYFQYFDELTKGERAGVQYALTQDEEFRTLVYDLLSEGKFRNWSQVRKLRSIWDNDEARRELVRARDESDPDEARGYVDRAVTTVDAEAKDRRTVAVDTRIHSFVTWLRKLPVDAFEEKASRQSLMDLQEALVLVEGLVERSLRGRGGA